MVEGRRYAPGVPRPAWSNWAGNQVARPVAVDHPASEDELVSIVKQAAGDAVAVKAVGAGHSFTDIAVTDGRMVALDRYDRVLAVDTERCVVTVEAGITLAALNAALDAHGLALPNLGDIAYQTVAGATSTSTHGTGGRLPGLAAQIVGLRLVTANGSVLSCSADAEPEVFDCARVGLGALGIVSTVTLQAVPAFHLHVVEEPLSVDDVSTRFDELVDGNDHFEFFWVPHTPWALTKTNNRTTAPLARRPRWRAWTDDVLTENVAYGLLCRVGRRRPQWIPHLARIVAAQGRKEYVDQSHRVFVSPRTVRFYEMEYAIPRAAAAEALGRVRRLLDDEGLRISFPVEVRATAADDIPLSTASGRASCYIAVHVFEGMEHERYFRGVERIMDDYEGRPHWGKLHFQTAATLAGRYPEWDRVAAVRQRLDPERRFTNAYLTRVLGP
jgi:FAD-linked oxidoreductase